MYLLVVVAALLVFSIPFIMAQNIPKERLGPMREEPVKNEPDILRGDNIKREKKPLVAITGEWTDPQGGHYYVRQDGNTIVWYGRGNSQGRFWHHIGSGTIQGNVIQATFRDLPRSTWPDNKGSIRGVINSQGNFVDWDRIPDWRR